jgi:hypothetical protein
MDIHEIGRELVKAILIRKEFALHYAGTPRCESCTSPRPGTEQIQGHFLCYRCLEEAKIRGQALADQWEAAKREHMEARRRDYWERQKWASQN